eukprot:TRINITY_DN548_c0_g1_i1.p1 TRINITY_DN548_c0_g1~~TRINITY_DN548_c0_g1_i1.p1  ORF type:complete len:294 (-),score=55.74 TRINITY_DN548_c0_g1_i1:61-942(-)
MESAFTQVLLAYWNIRGMGEPIRLSIEYLEIPYTQKIYSNEDEAEWYGKDKLALKSTFPNLPYLIDGNTVVTESEAIQVYLAHKAKKPDYAGKPEAMEQVLFTQIKGVLYDFRMDVAKYCYQTQEEFDKSTEETYSTKLIPRLERLEKHLAGKEYLTGYITFLDMILFEIVQTLVALDPKRIADFKNIEAHRQRILALPQIAAYYKSPRFIEKPINYPGMSVIQTQTFYFTSLISFIQIECKDDTYRFVSSSSNIRIKFIFGKFHLQADNKIFIFDRNIISKLNTKYLSLIHI